jgi:LysR family transcriptional regulator, glycine cleavage system transcriptional activator
MSATLPPLNACRAFEAATRLGSFARAAAELRVTPTAISHHVKVLEDWTGHRLFRRQNNAIVPTPEAHRLAPIIGEALQQIAEAARSLAGRSLPSLLSISVQPDFALKWLIPRLPRFAAEHPDVEIHLATSYRQLDLLAEGLDLAVRYLNATELAATSNDLRAEPLLGADLIPIVSPTLVPADSAADPEWLRTATLLHVTGVPDEWRHWLQVAGLRDVNPLRGPKFDSYALSGEAAAQGWGVALGRIGFIEADIAAGRLVAPFSTRLPGRHRWVLLSAIHSRNPIVPLMRRFMLKEAIETADD